MYSKNIYFQGSVVLVLALTCLFASQTTRAGDMSAFSPPPVLSSDNAISSAGYFRLSWNTQLEQSELQEADNPDFVNPSVVYSGPDQAMVISGKSNGSWYYRIRASNHQQSGPWSNVVTVTVKHHELSRAVMFLVLGVLVFLAMLVMILRGANDS